MNINKNIKHENNINIKQSVNNINIEKLDKKKEKNNLKENEKNKSEIKNRNINNIVNKNSKSNNKRNICGGDENPIILKLLSDKQNSILNGLKAIQENKDLIQNISIKNIDTPKSIIDNNVNKDKLRNLSIKEKELNEKLSSVKSELFKQAIKTNNNINLKAKFQKFLNKSEEEKRQKFISKLKKLRNEYKKINLKKEEFFKELEEREFKEKEQEKILKDKEKNMFLSEQRLKEKSMIFKRKQEIEQKINNIMKMNSKNKKISLKKNYLYLQMENDFLENEKNYIKEINEKRKIKALSPESTEKIAEIRNKFEERALKQKNELKKLWHSRSQVLQKLKSPIFNESYFEEKKNEKSKNLKQLIDDKKEYIKNHIKLPPISEILKKEIEERVNKKNSIISRNNRKKIINDNKKNFFFYSDYNSFSNDRNIKINIRIKNKNSESRNLLKSISMQTSRRNHIQNLKYMNNISKKIPRSPNDFNYLDEIKQKRIIKNNKIKNNNIKKDSFISRNNNINLENKIEAMESKYRRNKQLLKLQGGYLNNKDLSDNMNELLIDSIKRKLTIIENN